MLLADVKNKKISSSPGCYQFFDGKGKIIYIGKAANLKSRVLSYWREGTKHSLAKFAMMKKIKRIKIIETDSEIEALLLESNLIKKHKPDFNIVMRDDKRHVYIKITTEDEIPGIFITRKIDKNGKYFGPFVSTEAVRETLKAIRKIWPYCTERKLKKKPCFFHQVGRCTGVCSGLISIGDYKKTVIKPIILFLEGKKGMVVKNIENEIKEIEKNLRLHKDNKKFLISDSKFLNNKLNFLKYQIINIKKVLENVKILGVVEKYAGDSVELAKVLGLVKEPKRIEGYDIANIFGREAVGSMVVFSEGEPDKNEYRKFKIKIGNGKANDTGMIKEILERRFDNDWPLPDLIIIDGGRGQLNAVLNVLKKTKLDIMVIAISKGDGLRSARAQDKIFFPGEKKPLELPLASPALHLIKRVRDEAHRFAITYHRSLRKKRFIK